MRYTRLPFAQQQTLLRRVVDRASPGSRGAKVVVLDLDGTLIDNRPRTGAILHELADDLRTSHPRDAALLRGAVPDALGYLVRDSLRALGVAEDLVPEAEAFWKTKFFSDDPIRFDVALPGAIAFARACYERGAILAYFTGRDLPGMSVGTWKSLRDLGFPIGVPGTELVLKPTFEMPDEVFKQEIGPRLARLGEVVAVFDNEPANCNVLLAQHASAESVFVDTQHFPGAPPLDPKVHVVGDLVMDG